MRSSSHSKTIRLTWPSVAWGMSALLPLPTSVLWGVLSFLPSLHWVNNLPQALKEVRFMAEWYPVSYLSEPSSSVRRSTEYSSLIALWLVPCLLEKLSLSWDVLCSWQNWREKGWAAEPAQECWEQEVKLTEDFSSVLCVQWQSIWL